jgi:hypothetical protein
MKASDDQLWRDAVSAAAWMVPVSVILYFVPLLNGVIGGMVGGYRVPRMRPAILAGVLSGMLLTGFSLAFRARFLPIWNFAGRSGWPVLAIADAACLVIGAVAGVALAGGRRQRQL